MGKGNRPKQKRPKVLLLCCCCCRWLSCCCAANMKFVLFVFCADFCFSFSISCCAKIIKISKSSLKCKICVQACVCVWGAHSCGSVAERERKRWREGAYCSIYSTYNASSATQFPSSYESRSFNSFTCISLYLPRPLHSPSAVSGNSSLYFSTLTQ